MKDYCIITFCFGYWYYDEVNIFLEDIYALGEPIKTFVLTDNVNKIKKYWFVEVIDVSTYYSGKINLDIYYQHFDFFIKRFMFQIAFDNDYQKFIIADADSRLTGNKLDLKDVKINTAHAICAQSFLETKSNEYCDVRLQFYEQYFNYVIDDRTKRNSSDDNVMFFWLDRVVLYQLINWLESLYKLHKVAEVNTYPGINQELFYSLSVLNVPIYESLFLINFIYSQHKSEEEKGIFYRKFKQHS